MTPEVDGVAEAGPAPDPLAALQAWRARGAAPADPVAWCVVEALARRAAAQEGPARQLLVQRVEQRLAELGLAEPRAAAAVAASSPALAGLRELVDRLGRAPASPASPAPAVAAAMRQPPPAARPGSLRAVTAFKSTWSRLRAEQRLRQALAQVPAQAGPLNSQHLVHQALQAMHALSPPYLDAFMAHVDTLLWLEQSSGVGELSPRRSGAGAARRPRG